MAHPSSCMTGRGKIFCTYVLSDSFGQLLLYSGKGHTTSFFSYLSRRRAGHLGFAVLGCSSESFFHVNLIIEITYFWARLFKVIYPSHLQLIKMQKIAFHFIIKKVKITARSGLKHFLEGMDFSGFLVYSLSCFLKKCKCNLCRVKIVLLRPFYTHLVIWKDKKRSC